tara:strand:+ start:156 stop:398 length:243 start_codon:yes stop_codon:yes gene_type:complete
MPTEKDPTKFYLKPATAEDKVRIPGTDRHLPEEGTWMPRNNYWTRRLRDRSVVETSPPKSAPKSPPVPAKSAPAKPKTEA